MASQLLGGIYLLPSECQAKLILPSTESQPVYKRWIFKLIEGKSEHNLEAS